MQGCSELQLLDISNTPVTNLEALFPLAQLKKLVADDYMRLPSVKVLEMEKRTQSGAQQEYATW